MEIIGLKYNFKKGFLKRMLTNIADDLWNLSLTKVSFQVKLR
jgi:hypothetical protein